MPSDAVSKQYTRCRYCQGEIHWSGSSPERTAEEKNSRDSIRGAFNCPHCNAECDDIDRSFGECGSCFGELATEGDETSLDDLPDAMSKQVPLGTCIYACALLVAADKKVTPKEAEIVVSGLEWCGLDNAALKQKFIDACKRVHKEGSRKWIEVVQKSLCEDNGGGTGMAKHSLRNLLLRLVEAESSDSHQKMTIFEALKGSFS